MEEESEGDVGIAVPQRNAAENPQGSPLLRMQTGTSSQDGEDALSAVSSLSRQKGKVIFRSAHHAETKQTHHRQRLPTRTHQAAKKETARLSLHQQ